MRRKKDYLACQAVTPVPGEVDMGESPQVWASLGYRVGPYIFVFFWASCMLASTDDIQKCSEISKQGLMWLRGQEDLLLSQDPDLVPSIHGRWLTTLCSSSSRRYVPSSGLWGSCTLMAYIHTDTHIHKITQWILGSEANRSLMLYWQVMSWLHWEKCYHFKKSDIFITS